MKPFPHSPHTFVPAATVVPRRWHPAAVLGAAVLLLAAFTATHYAAPKPVPVIAAPLVAVALLVLARRAGLTWDDLGLGRLSWRRGAAYGLTAVAAVATVYAMAAVLPVTRAAFLDVRYHLPTASALVTAFVIIPVGTVLLEEIAFRGVILGLVRRHRGAVWATVVSSVLFGLWHIVPSLRLNETNPAVEAVVGSGIGARVAVIAAVVGFTALAGVLFCELRHRSGSLLAAAGLHWATNGLGVVVATVLWAAG